MNKTDITFAILDILMCGKLEIDVSNGNNPTYRVIAVGYDGEIIVSVTEQKINDAIILARDEITTFYQKRKHNE